MLHEVGSYINRSGRRRHAYYVISHYELFGYTTYQRLIIAAIARYVGRSRPSDDARPISVLSVRDRQLTPRASLLLRLARALNEGRHNAISHVNVKVRGDRVALEIKAKAAADLELWALDKERDYFREVFGRELVSMLS
jgi:exopolyphosphatase / guanosine-5'-triphosphate,3'-diphosphate pyrophosphatase